MISVPEFALERLCTRRGHDALGPGSLMKPSTEIERGGGVGSMFHVARSRYLTVRRREEHLARGYMASSLKMAMLGEWRLVPGACPRSATNALDVIRDIES